MTIQVNTDDKIKGSAELEQETELVVESALGHLAEHLTRVEVHLSDENGRKAGSRDKRCVMEARLEGHQPIAVAHEAEATGDAISGAAEKLRSSLQHIVGRVRDQ